MVNNLSQLASPAIEESQTPNANYLLTMNDSDCEIKETIISNNHTNKQTIKLNRINTFEIKSKAKKSLINNERKLNTCNNLSTKNTNFAKKNINENQDFKINMLNNLLGNLIINKKQSGSLTEQINYNKNPLNNNDLNKKNIDHNKKHGKINCEYNSLVKEDSQITEIKTDENASINNLKAYEGKTRNNAVILGRGNSNILINECNDLDESASLINFNFNNNNNNYNANNNSIAISFSESGRKSKLGNSFNKQIKFNLFLKMHDYANSNLIEIKELNNERNESTIKSVYDNREKKEVFCSFSKEYYNKNNDDSKFKNENLLKDYFSNLHMDEMKDYKDNLKAINSNISRLNTDKSQSSKNTSNINFYKNSNVNYLALKEKRKFLKNSFFNILTFLNGKDIKALYWSFKHMRLLIIDCLMMEVNRKLLNIFKINCGNFLDLSSKKLAFRKNNSI